MVLAAHGFHAERIAAPFPLWLIDTRPQPATALLRVLSLSEHERADRFVHAALRRRYQSAHAALRLLVEACCGIEAARQIYLPGAYGKPVLEDAQDIDCNISYSGDHALVALAMGTEIGVDLEVVRPIEDSIELAAMYYTEREIAQIAGQPASDHAFLTVWVRKEACSKALGKGLSIAPASFECGVGCGTRNVFIESEIVESNVLNPKGVLLASWAMKGRSEK